MKTLNLTSPETSEIKFEVSHFPDGQQDVKITYSPPHKGYIPDRTDTRSGGIFSSVTDKEVRILSRFNSFQDLELILCTTKALRRAGAEEVHLYIPYLLGARSDRKFTDGGTSYLVDIVAPILNTQNYKTVTTIDAHSDVAAACINNLQVVNNHALVIFALADMLKESPNTRQGLFNKTVLVSPDAGSLKKIYKVADALEYKGEYVICSKYRDWEGKLSRVEVPIRDSQIAKDFIIIDDICDGGRTFIEIAKVIKARANFSGKIYLIVTHGIFSGGFSGLASYFDAIYCTNSYSDVSKDLMRTTDFVKQLNVF